MRNTSSIYERSSLVRAGQPLMKRTLNVTNVRQSCVVSPLTWNAPVLFPLVYMPQIGPQERLSGQEAVSTSHTQAQGVHAEMRRVSRLHREVCNKNKKNRCDFFQTMKISLHPPTLSRWFTTNDQFAPSDPCLFCDKCFRMLHYDAQGKKLGDFLAYPYVDRGAFN